MNDDEDDAIDTIHYGDYIYLHDLRYDGYLSAEGILSDEVYVDSRSSTIFSSLFCIHLQRQYSAHRDLEEFKHLHRNDTAEHLKDPSTAKFLQALQRGVNNEQQLNEKKNSRRSGTPLVFGDVIQLFHVQSEKYVTVVPDKLANDERENLKVNLSAEGNQYSWLTLIPRYKIDRVGDRIVSKHEVFLTVTERANEFVHSSDKEPRPGRFREINCSLEETWWAVHLYQGFHANVEDKSQLMSTHFLILQDPETQSSVAITIKGHSQKENDDNDDVRKEITEAIQRAHDFDKVVLIPDKPLLDSNSLWCIEKKSNLKGTFLPP